jgi:hypothetical protein
VAQEKFYTVEEANALLPRLRPLLERIRDNHQAAGGEELVSRIREKAAHNGGGAPARQVAARSGAIERDVKQLNEWGIVLRDPSTGLIDFLHRREGQAVFLCWRLGESAVEWWHPLDTGIAGRRRL